MGWCRNQLPPHRFQGKQVDVSTFFLMTAFLFRALDYFGFRFYMPTTVVPLLLGLLSLRDTSIHLGNKFGPGKTSSQSLHLLPLLYA